MGFTGTLVCGNCAASIAVLVQSEAWHAGIPASTVHVLEELRWDGVDNEVVSVLNGHWL